MKLALRSENIPEHIEGFMVQSDFKGGRFSLGRNPSLNIEPAALHHRDELELNLALRGSARYLVGDKHFELKQNDMLWVLPKQKRLQLDTCGDFRAWVLAFRRRLVRRVCTTELSEELLRAGGKEVLRRRLTRPLVQHLHQLYSGVPVGTGRDVFNAGLAYALTSSWLAYRDASLGALPKEVHPAVRRAAWLMRDRPPTQDNTELAAACGLSAQRLSRLFKRQMGIPLTEFRNRCRIQHFLDIYGDGSGPTLTQAALDAGFGSYTQFHRVFSQQLGQSPAAFARRSRGEGA